MKRLIAMLMVFVMMLSLAACGSSDEKVVKEESTAQDVSAEETLSPREQFEQTKKAMEALNATEAATEAVAVEYTTNGITYTLDSSFESLTEDEDNFEHKYYNGIMYVTEQIVSNYFGYTSSKELAENRAEVQEGYTVGSANGVYYAEKASLGAVVAFYVDDSGYYWIISATCSQFDVYRDQMIEFCTSGRLN